MFPLKNYEIEIVDADYTAGPSAELRILYGITGLCWLWVDSRTVLLEKNAVFLLPPAKEARLYLQDGALAAVISLCGMGSLSPQMQRSFSIDSPDMTREWHRELQRRMQELLLAFTGGGKDRAFRELGEYYLLLDLLLQRFQTCDVSDAPNADRAGQMMAALWGAGGASISLRELAARLYLSTLASPPPNTDRR